MTALALEIDGRYRIDDFELDTSVAVRRGEFLALVGPNGSGKSTVLRLVAGLSALDEGRITIGGVVVDDAESDTIVATQHRRVGLVFQKPLLFAHLNVRDNVAYGLRSAGASKKDSRLAADRWLTDLDIARLADRRPDQLSGGQAQRVAFTRALAAEPPLLLLDEPFSSLDPRAAIDVRSWLAEQLERTATTTLAVLHDSQAVEQLADRVTAIDNGHLTFGPAPVPPPKTLLTLMGGHPQP